RQPQGPLLLQRKPRPQHRDPLSQDAPLDGCGRPPLRARTVTGAKATYGRTSGFPSSTQIGAFERPIWPKKTGGEGRDAAKHHLTAGGADSIVENHEIGQKLGEGNRSKRAERARSLEHEHVPGGVLGVRIDESDADVLALPLLERSAIVL